MPKTPQELDAERDKRATYLLPFLMGDIDCEMGKGWDGRSFTFELKGNYALVGELLFPEIRKRYADWVVTFNPGLRTGIAWWCHPSFTFRPRKADETPPANT